MAMPMDPSLRPRTHTPRWASLLSASTPKAFELRIRTSSTSVTSLRTSSRSLILRIRYPTSWPGPWYAASPPPSTSNTARAAGSWLPVQDVVGPPQGRLRGLHDPLREGRVRVHGEGDVLDRRAHRDREDELADQVRGVRSDDHRSKEELRLRVRDELHEALVLAHREGPPDRGERDLADERFHPLRPAR